MWRGALALLPVLGRRLVLRPVEEKEKKMGAFVASRVAGTSLLLLHLLLLVRMAVAVGAPRRARSPSRTTWWRIRCVRWGDARACLCYGGREYNRRRRRWLLVCCGCADATASRTFLSDLAWCRLLPLPPSPPPLLQWPYYIVSGNLQSQWINCARIWWKLENEIVVVVLQSFSHYARSLARSNATSSAFRCVLKTQPASSTHEDSECGFQLRIAECSSQ